MVQHYEEYKGPLPLNEQERLKKLLETGLIYSEENHLFNRIAKATKEHLGTATALVSLVEKDMQWFKARCGLNVTQTSRKASFCTHAILSPKKVMVVLDATKDERFRENELVTGMPHIRFYAGAPIIVQEKFAMGTLCVIDNKPRENFTKEESAFLQDMAAILAIMIEHHTAQTEKKMLKQAAFY